MRKNFKTYNNQPEVKKRDFNDVLDVFSSQFTPVEKAYGIATLPFQPVLHPLKTIKGVFETYNKLATLPLAVMSGNAAKVPDIIKGDVEFSGRDVVQQLHGGEEPHGILQNLEGFVFDVATDPFIGVVRLPHEASKIANAFTLHSAAPGLPTALRHFGAEAWIARMTGTGLGRDSKGVEVLDINSLPVREQKRAYQEWQKSKAAVEEAKRQKSLLSGEVQQAINNKAVYMQTLDGKEAPYIMDFEKFIEGEKIFRDANYSAFQQYADKQELARIAAEQHMHKEVSLKIAEFENLINKNGEMDWAQERKQIVNDFNKWKLENPFATEDQIQEYASKYANEYIAKNGQVNFNISALVNGLDPNSARFLQNKEINMLNVFDRKWRKSQGLKGFGIKQYNPIRHVWHKGEHWLFGDYATIVTPTGEVVPKKTYDKNPGLFKGARTDAVGRVNELFTVHPTPLTELHKDSTIFSTIKSWINNAEARPQWLKKLENATGRTTAKQDHLLGSKVSGDSDWAIKVLADLMSPKSKYFADLDRSELTLKQLRDYCEREPRMSVEFADMDPSHFLGHWYDSFFSEVVDAGTRSLFEGINDAAKEAEGISSLENPLGDDYIDEVLNDIYVGSDDWKVSSILTSITADPTALYEAYEAKFPNATMARDSVANLIQQRGFVDHNGIATTTFTFPTKFKDEYKLKLLVPADEIVSTYTKLMDLDYADLLLDKIGTADSVKTLDHLTQMFEAYKKGDYKGFLDNYWEARKIINSNSAEMTYAQQTAAEKGTADATKSASASTLSAWDNLENSLENLNLLMSNDTFYLNISNMERMLPNFLVEGDKSKLHDLFLENCNYETIKKGKKVNSVAPTSYKELSDSETLQRYLNEAKEYNHTNADVRERYKKYKYGPKTEKPAKKYKETLPLDFDNPEDTLETLYVRREQYRNERQNLYRDAYKKYKLDMEAPYLKAEELQKEIDIATEKLAAADLRLEEAFAQTTKLEKVNNELVAKLKSDLESISKNLNAEQLARSADIVRLTSEYYTDSLEEIWEVQRQIDKYAKGNPKAYGRIHIGALSNIYKNKKYTIGGKNLVRDLINTNFTFAGKFTAGELKKFEDLAEHLNTEIGIEDLFKVTHAPAPNHDLKIFALDTEKFYAKGGLVSDKDKLKTFTEWLGDNLEKEHPEITVDAGMKRQFVAKLNETEQALANSLRQAMLASNTRMREFAEFAGIADQFEDIETYFPHAITSINGKSIESVILDGPVVTDHNIQLASRIKNQLKLTGTLGASTTNKSILVNPIDFTLHHKYFSAKENKMVTKPKRFFTLNPSSAYQKAFSSAFAQHERLTIAKEIMFHDNSRIKNLKITNLPIEAVASTDILVPVYRNKQLVKIRKYAPTKANIEKYKNNGHLVDKTVSAEIRAMMKYSNTIAQSPTTEWFTKNINSAFKKGVLLNLGFPLGNAGDMYFKTLADLPYHKWPTQHKNMAAAFKAIQSHETHMKAYATLKTSTTALTRVSYYEYLNDMEAYLTRGKTASWMKSKEVQEHLAGRQKLMTEGVDVIQDLNNAIMYEVYSTLPTATTNYRETLLSENEMIKGDKDIDFSVWLRNTYKAPVGRMLSAMSEDNFFAKNFHNWNEKLENAMRFSNMMSELGGEVGKTMPKVSRDQQWLANEILKYNHMHFAEMPGDAVWLSVVMPFWQFPLKNAAWWGRFIAKKPQFAAQVNRFKAEMWDDEQDSFWAKLGALPISDNLVMRGIPGLGSYQSFALGMEDTTDMLGNRLSPVIRPFVTTNGQKYKPYSIEDRNPHNDNLLKAWLHGMNPIEGNIQYGLNLVGNRNKPLADRVLPSAIRSRD